MAEEIKTLGELMADEEARLMAEANTPERIAADQALAERNSARLKAEHARGVELGWFDEEGNPLGEPEEDEDEEGDS